MSIDQEQRQLAFRLRILEAARELIESDGIQNFSIRKLTKVIGYSPGIVYHYFKDKNEIIDQLTQEGYQKILASLTSPVQQMSKEEGQNEFSIESEIRNLIKRYIQAALEQPSAFMAFMMTDDSKVLEKTAMLHKGVSGSRQSLALLRDALIKGVKKGEFELTDPELTAQLIWCSVFGLVIRLILEKQIDENRRQLLIDSQMTQILKGIRKVR